MGRLSWHDLERFSEQNDPSSPNALRPVYRWQHIAGAMGLLWLVLAVMWTFWSIDKTRDKREKAGEQNATQGLMKQQTQ